MGTLAGAAGWEMSLSQRLIEWASDKFWTAYARLENWWATDIWGWIVDVPMSDPYGGHCTGRRSRKRVYCPNCDDGTYPKVDP